eukprot:141928_1
MMFFGEFFLDRFGLYNDRFLDNLSLLIQIGNWSFEVISNICWSVYFLADIHDTDEYPNIQMQYIYNSRLLIQITELLNHKSCSIREISIRAIGNIACGSDQAIKAVVNTGILNKLGKIITNDNDIIKKYACWLMSNITTCETHIIAVRKAKLFIVLFNIIKCESYYAACEAIWAVSNATIYCNKAEMFMYMIDNGIFDSLCHFIKVLMKNDYSNRKKMFEVLLEALRNIFRVRCVDNIYYFKKIFKQCGGLDILNELLQFYDDVLTHNAKQLIHSICEHFKSCSKP